MKNKKLHCSNMIKQRLQIACSNPYMSDSQPLPKMGAQLPCIGQKQKIIPEQGLKTKNFAKYPENTEMRGEEM